MKLDMVGKWAFIVGLILAVVVGFIFQASWVVWVLAILGVIVGLLNVTGEDTEKFLLAAIAFALSVTALNAVPVLGTLITNISSHGIASCRSGASNASANGSPTSRPALLTRVSCHRAWSHL